MTFQPAVAAVINRNEQKPEVMPLHPTADHQQASITLSNRPHSTFLLLSFHLFLPEFVPSRMRLHFINGFHTSFSVKLWSTEILTESPKHSSQEQRCSQWGGAGRRREMIQPVGISSFPGITKNVYIDSSTWEHFLNNFFLFLYVLVFCLHLYLCEGVRSWS